MHSPQNVPASRPPPSSFTGAPPPPSAAHSAHRLALLKRSLTGGGGGGEPSSSTQSQSTRAIPTTGAASHARHRSMVPVLPVGKQGPPAPPGSSSGAGAGAGAGGSAIPPRVPRRPSTTMNRPARPTLASPPSVAMKKSPIAPSPPQHTPTPQHPPHPSSAPAPSTSATSGNFLQMPVPPRKSSGGGEGGGRPRNLSVSSTGSVASNSSDGRSGKTVLSMFDFVSQELIDREGKILERELTSSSVGSAANHADFEGDNGVLRVRVSSPLDSSEDIGATFSNKLLHQYENVENQGKVGLKSMNKSLQFVKNVMALEREYAEKLNLLASTEIEQFHKNDNPDRMQSLSNSTLGMYSKYTEIAQLHNSLAQRMEEAVITPFENAVGACEDAFSKAKRRRKEAKKELTAAEKEYEGTKSKAKAAIEGDERSQKMSDMRRRMALVKYRKSALEAANKYNDALTQVNFIQKLYWSTHMPAVFTDLQAMEELRIASTKQNLGKCASMLQESFATLAEVAGEVPVIMERVSVEADVTSFTKNTVHIFGSNEGYEPKKYELHRSIDELFDEEKEKERKAAAAAARPAGQGGATGGAAKQTNLFGGELKQIMTLSINKDLLVPKMIADMCTQLEQMGGFKKEGVFRLSPAATEIARLKRQISSHDYEIPPGTDPHAIAGIIKMFLRELASPLIPEGLYQKCIRLGVKEKDDKDLASKEDRLDALLQELPAINRNTLEYLVKFLHRVSQHSDANRMGIENLAIIFAPSFLRDPSNDPMSMMRNAQYESGFVIYLLETLSKRIDTPTSAAGPPSHRPSIGGGLPLPTPQSLTPMHTPTPMHNPAEPILVSVTSPTGKETKFPVGSSSSSGAGDSTPVNLKKPGQRVSPIQKPQSDHRPPAPRGLPPSQSIAGNIGARRPPRMGMMQRAKSSATGLRPIPIRTAGAAASPASPSDHLNLAIGRPHSRSTAAMRKPPAADAVAKPKYTTPAPVEGAPGRQRAYTSFDFPHVSDMDATIPAPLRTDAVHQNLPSPYSKGVVRPLPPPARRHPQKAKTSAPQARARSPPTRVSAPQAPAPHKRASSSEKPTGRHLEPPAHNRASSIDSNSSDDEYALPEDPRFGDLPGIQNTIRTPMIIKARIANEREPQQDVQDGSHLSALPKNSLASSELAAMAEKRARQDSLVPRANAVTPQATSKAQVQPQRPPRPARGPPPPNSGAAGRVTSPTFGSSAKRGPPPPHGKAPPASAQQQPPPVNASARPGVPTRLPLSSPVHSRVPVGRHRGMPSPRRVPTRVGRGGAPPFSSRSFAALPPGAAAAAGASSRGTPPPVRRMGTVSRMTSASMASKFENIVANQAVQAQQRRKPQP